MLVLSAPRRSSWRYELAILHNPRETTPPSDAKALALFCQAARALRIRAELITADDAGKLAAFDALFIRETTAVNHHSYRISQRAAAQGLVVIDDPQSILRCTNKVYLKELLEVRGVRTPRSIVAHRHNVAVVGALLGFPCVLKVPDSGFSKGVVKCDDRRQLEVAMESMLKQSDLLVAQEWLPTDFDWRIGIIDRRPLFACRYGMAENHWQIYNRTDSGDVVAGWFETVAVEDAPPAVVKTALRAANLIGDGFYGVDLKYSRGKVHVIEINDNPNVDEGVEDGVLDTGLYHDIMEVFLRRIDQRRGIQG